MIKAQKAHAQETPRLKPIENPKNLKLKIAYWFIEWKIGKVLTPVKVFQARMPDTLSLAYKMKSIQNKLSLPNDLVFYIKNYVATLNGCDFCVDISKAEAEEDVSIKKYKQLNSYQSSTDFTDAEKAALTYVQKATLDRQVSDHVFADLQNFFNEVEIIEITWLNAMENFYNLLNTPLQIPSDNLCKVENPNHEK